MRLDSIKRAPRGVRTSRPDGAAFVRCHPRNVSTAAGGTLGRTPGAPGDANAGLLAKQTGHVMAVMR